MVAAADEAAMQAGMPALAECTNASCTECHPAAAAALRRGRFSFTQNLGPLRLPPIDGAFLALLSTLF